MRNIPTLALAIAFSLPFVACVQRKAVESHSTVNGASADELRAQYPGLMPQVDGLYRVDPATGETVVNVVVLTMSGAVGSRPDAKENYLVGRNEEWGSRALASFRDWLGTTSGQARQLGRITETVTEGSEVSFRFILDLSKENPAGDEESKKKLIDVSVPDDRYLAIAPAGPRLGGAKGKVRWNVTMHVGPNWTKHPELRRAVREASIVLVNGWVAGTDQRASLNVGQAFYEEVSAGKGSKLVLLNMCETEKSVEDTLLAAAATSGLDLQIISNRKDFTYGGFAPENAALVTGLSNGWSWERILDAMPGKVLRTKALGALAPTTTPNPIPTSAPTASGN